MADSTHRDALPEGKVRGRGAGLNPGNRFVRGASPGPAGGGDAVVRLHILGEHLDREAGEHPEGRQVATVVFDDDTRSVLNELDSPDLPFRWTLNPYRGCEHGCIYCYARPTHETLGFSCGLDFETRIVAKRNAPALLRRALARPSWKGETISMSGVTDPYQPVERDLRITRGCLEVMAERSQPVGVVTKSRLVLRDLDLLTALAARGAASVAISVTTLDASLARRMEPRASAPRERLDAVRTLAAAGVPVMVLVAPIVPGLTDHELPAILREAASAGARSAAWTLLRLPHQVKELFLDWLERELPDRAARIEHAVRATRGGELSDPRFGSRFRGDGPLAQNIARTFEVFSRRYGLDRGMRRRAPAAQARPAHHEQLGLFD